MDIIVSTADGRTNIHRFKTASDKPREFQLIDIDGIPCAYCGNNMISGKTLNREFTVNPFKKDLFIERAKRIEAYLKPLQKKVLDYLISIRNRNDFTTDEDILNMAHKECEQIVLTDLVYRFQKIRILIENSSNRFLKARLAATQDFYKKILRSKNYEELIRYIRSKGFLDISPNTDDETSKKVNSMIYGLKLSEGGSVNGYIMSKFDRNNPQNTYRELFTPSMATIEHIIPSSVGGKSKIFNYLSVCKKCNNERKSKHIKFYLKEHPNVLKNIENQLRLLNFLIPELIRYGNLEIKYRRYPHQVAVTLERLTSHYFDI